MADDNNKILKERKQRLVVTTVSFILLLLFLGLLSSCIKDDSQEPETIHKVLLVYLAGDNNLSGESHTKLEAIRQGYAHSADTRILVYQDAADIAPRLFEIDGTLIEQYPQENSAQPAVLRRVIAQAKSLYPQARFNLLVFSHASGWLPDKALVSPRSVIADGSSYMELTDFADAIPDQAFGYIVFETCFMAGIEVAYQLRHKADYILASSAEIVSPGFTPVYREQINELVSGSPRRFMRQAFDYFNHQTGYMRSATFSMIQTNGLGALAEYVRGNCDFSSGLDINNVQYFDRNAYHLFFDFGDYYSRLLGNDSQKLQFELLVDDVVIDKAATSSFMQGYQGFVINKYSGMTTYIKQNQYPMMNKNYTNLDWYKDTRK